ncbi:MAG: hypothetical protein AAGD04_08015 [Pseudomonadota bacterium]
MRFLSALAIMGLLAACGADGAPVRPSANVSIGVGPNGVTVTPRATVRKGNVSVGVGL